MSKFVVVIGGVQSGADQAQVVKKLSIILKSDEKKIQALMAKAPFKVKSGLNLEQARKVKSALEKTGARCLIKEIGAKPEGKAVKISESPKPEAPGLQMENPDPDASPTPPDSAGLQMENPEPDPKSAHAAGKPIESCPSCGYEATSKDDPLLTAHSGLGECPKCGVIRQRVEKAQIKGSWDSPQGEDAREVSKRPPVWMLASAGGLVVALIVVIGLLVFGSKPEPQTAGGGGSSMAPMTAADQGDELAEDEAVEAVDEAAEEDTGEDAACILPVNSSETITLSGYAPIFHDSENWAEIDGVYNVYRNPLENAGMKVSINFVYFGRETFDMPNVQVKNDLMFSVFGKKTARQLEIRPVHWWYKEKKSSSAVFVANDVYTILDMRNIDESEYLKKMTAFNKNPERVIWRDFTVYPVNIDLSFYVPDGETIRAYFKKSTRAGAVEIILNAVSFSLTKDGETKELKVHPEQFKFYMLASPVWEDREVVGLKVKPYKIGRVYSTLGCPGFEMQ